MGPPRYHLPHIFFSSPVLPQLAITKPDDDFCDTPHLIFSIWTFLINFIPYFRMYIWMKCWKIIHRVHPLKICFTWLSWFLQVKYVILFVGVPVRPRYKLTTYRVPLKSLNHPNLTRFRQAWANMLDFYNNFTSDFYNTQSKFNAGVLLQIKSPCSWYMTAIHTSSNYMYIKFICEMSSCLIAPIKNFYFINNRHISGIVNAIESYHSTKLP